jgi:hypothetical protein
LKEAYDAVTDVSVVVLAAANCVMHMAKDSMDGQPAGTTTGQVIGTHMQVAVDSL